MAEVGGRKIREGLLRGEKNREVRQYEKKGNNLDTWYVHNNCNRWWVCLA